MSKDTRGPAYPSTGAEGGLWNAKGATLRQWYAGLAMQGYLSRNAICIPDDEPFDATVSKLAFEMADAMIAEGNK